MLVTKMNFSSWCLVGCILLLISIKNGSCSSKKAPHIILIVADDLGWNDVGFHGSIQIPTPNINALAYAGVILNNYYVQPICTPSRSALLSGMHPIHTGLNHDVIYGAQPYGLPLKLDLLPKFLNGFGYRSHAVGKWHLGMCMKQYLPVYRGFSSHYGYWTGHEDYFSHTSMEGHGTIGGPHPYGLPLSFSLLPQHLKSLGYTTKHVGKWHIGCFKKDFTPTYRGFESHMGYWTGRVDYYDHTALEHPGWWGYDFRRNMDVDREAYGKYTTDLFTNESIHIIKHHDTSRPLFLYLAHLAVHSGNPYDPLQAPADVVKKFSYIKDENRRKFAGMLWKLDESVGEVIRALQLKDMLTNSLIVFTTDNGGPAAGFNLNAASNWPLRGVKAGLWEGGIRGAAFVWSPLIENPGRVSTEMMQIMDWLPTLYSAAGGDVSDLPQMDGMNLWPSIAKGERSPRTEMLHNIDPIQGGAALRVGEWKLVYHPSGYGPDWDGWFGPSGRSKKESHSTNQELEYKSLKKSVAGRAIREVLHRPYRNIQRIKEDAEVLCGPVPRNATKACNNPKNPCLFHIPSDPCEFFDVSAKHPDQLKLLKSVLKTYNATAVPPANKPWDPKANPVFWSYTWTHWQDYFFSPFQLQNLPNPPKMGLVRDHIWL